MSVPHPEIAHLFEFPRDGSQPGVKSRHDLCVPQKNGNRNFGALLHAAWMGSPPQNETELLDHMHLYSRGMRDIRESTSTSQVYFVARNPYARLLSEFLNHQVGQCVRGSLGCHVENPLPNNSTGFDQWVDSQYQQWLERGSKVSNLDNHHLFSQLDGCAYPPPAKVHVLHLEEQPCWFGCLLGQTGISSGILLGEAWRPLSGTPCYLPNNGACVDWRSQEAQESKPSIFVGPVHGTAAALQLDTYYTPAAMQRASAMYANDFAFLGYPTRGLNG